MQYNFPLLPIITEAEEARDAAIEWQKWQADQSLSYQALAAWQSYFEELGKKFNLTEEFRENGII